MDSQTDVRFAVKIATFSKSALH